MADFTAPITPIAVPALPSNASADQLATFSANFTRNIVTTGNSLLAAYIAQKDTDFYSVGDIPVLGPQLTFLDPDLFNTAKERPTTAERDAIDFPTLRANIEQLAALTTPSLPDLLTPSSDIPELTASAPVILLPTAPDADVGAAPGGAPSLETPTTPDAPSIILPTVPTLEDLRLPESPSLVMPEWSAVAPQNLLTPPTAVFAYVDTGYVSTLHDPLVQKLLSDLQNGSYGIDANDEAQLWSRAQDRATRAGRSAADEAIRRAAGMSFPMPQGSMLEIVQQAEDKVLDALTEANRDIALKRADMYVEGRKFTIQQVQSYEKIRIDLYNATQERALNYAKAVVETGIAIYDSSVRNFQAQLQAYQTESQVFANRVQAELSKAQIYRTQIEAEGLRMQYNRARVEAYQAQLQGITTVVELYKSRIAAAKLFMELQGQKIDLFRGQVQAYAERVKAKEAEFGIYKAQIGGQLAQLDVYKSQIDAHNAVLGGREVRARIQLQGNESLLQRYRAAVELYRAQLDSFSKQISARVEEAKTRGSLYGADIDAYRAFVDGAMSSARVNSDLNRYNLDWNKATLAARVEQVGFRFKQLLAGVDLQKAVNKDGIEFLRTALGAAASGINSLGVRTDEG